MILCSPFVGIDPLLFIGGALAILGLPLLLVKKHPVLLAGWLVWFVGYFALVISHYRIFNGPMSPLYGFTILPQLLATPIQESGLWIPAVALFYLAYLMIAALTILLPIFTVRTCLRWRKTRRKPA